MKQLIEDLRVILIQTGFNIERMIESKVIKDKAYRVLKFRNDMALAELEKLIVSALAEIKLSDLAIEFAEFRLERYEDENLSIKDQFEVFMNLKI